MRDVVSVLTTAASRKPSALREQNLFTKYLESRPGGKWEIAAF